MSVKLTRADLVALKETIELTPGFEGRTQARDAVREVLRERQPALLWIEESILEAVARRIVPVDIATATLRSRLDRALQDEQARESSAVDDAPDLNATRAEVPDLPESRALAV